MSLQLNFCFKTFIEIHVTITIRITSRYGRARYIQATQKITLNLIFTAVETHVDVTYRAGVVTYEPEVCIPADIHDCIHLVLNGIGKAL